MGVIIAGIRFSVALFQTKFRPNVVDAKRTAYHRLAYDRFADDWLPDDRCLGYNVCFGRNLFYFRRRDALFPCLAETHTAAKLVQSRLLTKFAFEFDQSLFRELAIVILDIERDT